MIVKNFGNVNHQKFDDYSLLLEQKNNDMNVAVSSN